MDTDHDQSKQRRLFAVPRPLESEVYTHRPRSIRSILVVLAWQTNRQSGSISRGYLLKQ